MAILKVCILKNGRVLVWTKQLEPKAARLALWDTARQCEVDPAGQPVPAPSAAVREEPPVPADLEVLPGPQLPAAEPAGAVSGGAGTAAEIRGKQALREYAIAQFGLELPARATEEQMRARIAALEHAALTEGMDSPNGAHGMPGPAGIPAPEKTPAETEATP